VERDPDIELAHHSSRSHERGCYPAAVIPFDTFHAAGTGLGTPRLLRAVVVVSTFARDRGGLSPALAWPAARRAARFG